MAIHNVKRIQPLGNNEWEIETPCGAGKLVPHFEQEFGSSTTNSLIRRKGAWAVSARIVPAGAEDAAYMITLVKPPGIPEEVFW